MRLKPLPVFIVLAVLTGCATTTQNTEATTETPAPLSPTAQQASYNLGLMHINTLSDGQYPLDQSAYGQGLRDALAGKSAPEPTQAEWQALAGLSYAELKAANLAAGHVFLAQNKANKGVVLLPGGVQYLVLKEGKGEKPRLKDTVGIMYTISGIDGKLKADTMTKGKAKMYEIKLEKILSKGWQEALLLMPQESKWRLFIPGELAFGEKGLSEKGVLPNETLVIDTYLLEIK
ncbi:MAG: FKBP-type peptidyl-prolyl cis-trans isomerase N-terminal domain-containing protein [Methylovulum sp.]|uniref:FKBP-type peptidyl-prolyl cis-trans isomerase N-terminal domain-containing protein n=1 Tax=Methylovulum sp. TaxID=1916980 RepID=UPI00260CE42A|nr:FKBP-type peptidyl-prolyl cis-trans isomerase N-terminal domain-containing protein [Methylovulum sp.]MDD2724318.1 FKBP-type peptidyl-prolyl cis-trans isomerase N-terminal domain-containing protein [Methylovulum sp.]MDD5124962.1 FKBP-type peptidyl-prolyl cis-trans isomerase N-terminal domain-containing protein [Methylovulum sp.]